MLIQRNQCVLDMCVLNIRRCLSIIILGLLLGTTSPASAQGTTQEEPHASSPKITGDNSPANNAQLSANEAPVVVLNRKIAVFRAPFLGVSPEIRAKRSEQMLSELLERVNNGVVSVSNAPQGNVVLINGQMALILVDGDADSLRGETLATITNKTVLALGTVIAETEEARDHNRLLRGFAYTALATVIFVLALWLVAQVRKRLSSRLAHVFRSGAANIHIGGSQFLPEERVAAIAHYLVSIISWLLILLLSYEWLSYSLSQFPYTRPWGEELNQYLIGIAVTIGSSILHALPNLLIAFIIFLLARMTIRLFSPFFDKLEAGTTQFGSIDADTAKPTRWLFSVGVWLFAIVMAYPYLPGSQSDAFRGMSVLVGLMVSVGGASLLGQAASGLILMYSRTLRMGEYVRINDHEGTVTELRTFTTKIRTGHGEELTFPNSLVLGTVTKNYSRTVKGVGYIVDTTVTIGYDTPWRQVEAMLMEAASRTTGVVPEPAPHVFQTALTDFYPEYHLVCQAIPTEPRPRAKVLAELHANIQDVFNEHGVQIMSPHYLGDPQQAKIVPKNMWFAAPAKPDA